MRSASMISRPFLLIVAPITSLPTCLSAGITLPVSIDSSTADAPSITTPSTGMRSPGRTTSRSPTLTCSMGTSTSSPSRNKVAVRGARPISFLIASLVRPFARASSSLPRVIRVRMTAAVSK